MEEASGFTVFSEISLGIWLVRRRRGLGLRVQPPISLVLATCSSAYVAGLTATRYVGPPDSAQARDGFDRWVRRYACVSTRSWRRPS